MQFPDGHLRERVQQAALSVGARSREAAQRSIRAGVEVTLNALASSPAFYRLVDEVVQYLVHHPDVEALIHEQTSNIVVDAVDDLRIKAARADTAFDRMIAAFRRRVRTLCPPTHRSPTKEGARSPS